MRVGLDFIDQIRTLRIKSPNPTQDQALSFEQRSANAGGGWIATQIQKIVSSIQAGYHSQHNEDDTHSTITASGSITERLRDLPMGEWTYLEMAASRFTGNGTMTWTVPAFSTSYITYMLVGQTMFVRWNLVNTTVGGVVNTILQATIHSTLTPKFVNNGTAFAYRDNAVAGTGYCQSVRGASGSGTNIQFFINAGAATNWTASAALTAVIGELCFELLET